MARVHVEAYGCSASFADSEMISGLLANGGHSLAESEKDADLSVIVTCSVKDATAKRMIHRIKSLNAKPLIVAGCLPKAEERTVAKFAPGASMMGPNSIGQTLLVADAALAGKRMLALEDTDDAKTGLPKVRLNPAVGIIEIASGCMSECTFCQTKLAKGDLKSYRIGDIVREAESEVSQGCAEIWLSSTDNGCYGLDIGTDLPELVDAVAAVPRSFMIRVGMMNPMYMPRIQDRLQKSFASGKVYKFIHVPVQSGSGRVLADMRRGHTADTFRDIVRTFREKDDRFAVSTDIIVGFPTEAEEDYEDTVSLVAETKPDIVNLSRYSARPGTKAAAMEQIDAATVKRRSKKLYDMASRISYERNKEWVGWSGPVLFDEISRDGIKGRNYAYKPVWVKDNVRLGSTHTVRITSAASHSLKGTVE